MIRRVFEFCCDNCKRTLLVRVGGSVHDKATAKRCARENGWSCGATDRCEQCHRQSEAHT